MNQFKTFILMLGLTMILVLLGGVIGGRGGATFAFLIALGLNFLTYYHSDRIVLAIYRAQELKRNEAPWLHDLVEDLSQRMGIPKPRIYLIPQPAPNAFATGRSPKVGCVAVTEGLLRILDEEEIRGVLGHELSHIKNRDTLIQTISASIAGAISMLAFWARWAAFLGGYGDSEERGNPFFLLLISILAPLAALIVQMAISRSREYLADERGGRACGNPLYLARALRKLAGYQEKYPMEVNPATSHLFIVNPLSGESFFSVLFSTHPPLQERIRRLEALASRPGGNYVF